ncbi:uncharacterized protein LOC125539921 [Triticum urartu]|uniref:uncharacterized protein LOC125539921 n=1 Tax=Triticum urartu TaxID=4572 RepID=UPI0020449BE7|nr:uncharacterized protein LOC125539921 [Triticum urartu]
MATAGSSEGKTGESMFSKEGEMATAESSKGRTGGSMFSKEGEMATAGSSKGWEYEFRGVTIATIESSKERPGGLSKEFHQAGLCLQNSIREIEAKISKIGHCDQGEGKNFDYLHVFRSDMLVLLAKIFRLAYEEDQQTAGWIGNKEESMETESKIGDCREIETLGKSSKGCRSAGYLELENLLHRARIQIAEQIGRGFQCRGLHDLVAKETQGHVVGQAHSQLPWDTVPDVTTEILLKFEKVVGDIDKLFQAEKIRKEAMAVLRFGFRLHLFSEQIVELRHEMSKMLQSFSSVNKDIRSTLLKFISEPYLGRICKLQRISERLSMLQRMYPDFNTKLKSTIIKLKSESFSSAMEELKQEEESGREGVAAEGHGDQKVSMEMEGKRFASYRRCWECIWGNDRNFEDQTLLSPMLFTHCTTRIPSEAVAGSTLQIYSIKISTAKELTLPLEVYGVVAVRDAVDRHRNPLFLRSRMHCQVLEKNDSFLSLTGPVRAIVSMDTVYIEIQLKVKGATESEDTSLISTFGFYNGDSSGSYLAKNSLCTVELCYEQLKQSVQATIVGVFVTPKQESLPFPYGGRVICSSLPQDGNEDIDGLPPREVLLLDSKGEGMSLTSNGYLSLARRVVSVELKGKLQVLIMAESSSQNAEIAAQFFFTPEKYDTSKCDCSLPDGSKVEITVAWSLVPSTMLQSGDSHEDSGMVTARYSKGRSDGCLLGDSLCMATLSMQQSVSWVQAREDKILEIGLRESVEHSNLLKLKFDMLELLENIFARAEYDTHSKICDDGDVRPEYETHIKICDDGEMETGGKPSKGRSGDVELLRIGNEGRMLQTPSKIGDGGKLVSKHFKEQMVRFSMSVARSVRNVLEEEAEAETETSGVVPMVGFKLGLLSRQFDELWDDMRQLVSTEAKFLAICMLIHEPFARYCSTLKFISAVFNRLCRWVPDLTTAMGSIREHEEIEDGDKVGKFVNEYEEEKKAEQFYFSAHRENWEFSRSNFGSFEDTTVLSSMLFTHYIPGHTQLGADVGRTMQVYSIKVVETAETEGYALEWPLKVYGVVAARDVVDYRRNILFLRTRDDCQILTKQDPFLHLTGPSRAIISGDILDNTLIIEVHLRLKDMVESEDRTLISKAFVYDEDDLGSGDSISEHLLQGLCSIELRYEHIEQSLQATILGIRVIQGPLCCGNGIKVFCSALPKDKTQDRVKCPFECVLLLGSQTGTVPVGGYLDLSRQVVSVKLRGELKILIQAEEISGSVVFKAEDSNISRERCRLGDCEVEITIAWSLLVESQHDLSVEGYIAPYAEELISPMPIMKLYRSRSLKMV